jgi:polar amino acid transport system permease protein
MDNFDKKLISFWESFATHGAYHEVLEGLKNTLLIAVLGLIIGTLIGTLIATVRVMPKYRILPRVLDTICSVYVAFFRGTPIVVQLLLFYYVLFPLIGARVDSMTVSVLVFGLNSGAYISEIMRGGILSVDSGQMEGGRAMGLSFSASMIKIVIPQAIKNILPTMGNEFITLIKETSVVSFVGALDLYKAFNSIGTSNYEWMVPFLAMALIYIVIVLFITFLIKVMERRLRKSDRSM